jgi:capsular polysaccharide biosynthesis protein
MVVHAARRRPRRAVRYTIIVVLGLLLGVIVGIALTVFTTKSYVANSTLFVTVPAQTANELNDGNVFAEARVQSYADIATSPAILNAVIRTTNVAISESTLASEVTATAPPNKVLLMLSVQDASAERALTLCRGLSSQVIASVHQLESDGQGKSSIRLSVVRAAELPTSPSAPRPALYIGASALLGLVIGAVVALTLGQFAGRRDEVDLPNAES